MSKEYDPLRQLIKILGIQLPLADQAVLMKNYDSVNMWGEMSVQVKPDIAGVVKVIAKTVNADQPDPNDTTGAVALTKNGNVFGSDTFRVTNLPQMAPFAANKKFCYWGLDNTDTVIETGDTVTFTAVPNPCTGTVLATQLIWLTYAAADKELPTFHEHTHAGSPYIPFGVRVPQTAKTVQIATAGGPWAHDPAVSEESGPEGKAGTDQNLAAANTAEYQSANLLSTRIAGISLPLNRLVGLWEYRNPDDETTTEFAIPTTAFNVQPTGSTHRPRRLRLAMHDGFEWSNNHGQITVTITWAE